MSVVSTASWLGVPVIVLGELRAGFLLGSQADKNEVDLRAFLANPAVYVLDVDENATTIYAEMVVALHRAGSPVPTNDLWIAAVAAREGATVLTYDARFERIARVGVRLLASEQRTPGEPG